MTRRVAIIADDLTGALDAGAPFAARGAKVLVATGLAAARDLMGSIEADQADVIALNTESRHLGATAAAHAARQAAEDLHDWRPDHWYKKIDSTLRGQVVAETLALHDYLGKPLLFCPANPQQQRIMRNGRVQVAEQPIEDTIYAVDGCSAARTDPLRDQFASAGVAMQLCQTDHNLPADPTDCIADAETPEDLVRIQTQALLMRDRHPWISTGAGGLAEGLATCLFGGAAPTTRPPPPGDRRLYVVGSRNPRAIEQIAQLKAASPRTQHQPKASSWQIVTPSQLADDEYSAEFVAAQLGEIAATAVAQWAERSGLIVLCGGDIAIAVLRALTISTLWLEREWLPGLPLARACNDPRLCVITKPGGFGEADLFAQLESTLS